jgi:hypothetical protein
MILDARLPPHEADTFMARKYKERRVAANAANLMPKEVRTRPVNTELPA